MQRVRFVLCVLVGLVGCNGYDRGATQSTHPPLNPACNRQEVYCYLTNFSFGDTLLVAPAKLVIDDSLIVAEQVPRNQTGSERFSKLVRLCEGTHQVHIEFGPYSRDTTFAVSMAVPVSLLATLTCRAIPALANEDGVSVVTLDRDGLDGID